MSYNTSSKGRRTRCPAVNFWYSDNITKACLRLSTCCSATCASCGRLCCAASESIKVSGFWGGAIAVGLFCEYIDDMALCHTAADTQLL